jgi:REP element-mobilizing transposase RayT
MRTIFIDICLYYHAQLVEFNGEVEHVHLLINYPPQDQLSKMVNSLKGISSRLLKNNLPTSPRATLKTNFFGPLDTLQLRAVVLQLVLFVNILSNKKHQNSYANLTPYILHLKVEVFGVLDKNLALLNKDIPC